MVYQAFMSSTFVDMAEVMQTIDGIEQKIPRPKLIEAYVMAGYLSRGIFSLIAMSVSVSVLTFIVTSPRSTRISCTLAGLVAVMYASPVIFGLFRTSAVMNTF